MIYRELGKTGMKLSAIGFGASSLGGVFHDFEEAKGIGDFETTFQDILEGCEAMLA